jgi:hypothetical protein
MPITVGPFTSPTLSTPPCRRKLEYPEKTHDFQQSVDFTVFTLRKFSLRLEPAALEVKGKCTNYFATEAPIFPKRTSSVLYYKVKHKLK